MTALLVVLMFLAFVALDFGVRALSRRVRESRERREREQILATSVRLDVAHEAPSLKRAEVPEPAARILAVDDEPVVLDSLRRILVLDGYSVDTVESGPEALGLVQRHDYDLVFTDLKMPRMDGVEVVKAVKHLRPDVDVAVITGYATIESAVETMMHGAADYVQKPFTPRELSEFVKRLLVRRAARIEAQRRPSVRIVSPAEADAVSEHEYCIPGGAFLGSGHTWARIEPGGQVRIGLDDFARRALGAIAEVGLPSVGIDVGLGEALFTLSDGPRAVRLPSPLSGRVVRVNDAISADPDRVTSSPYDRGWICLLQPSDLAGELTALRIGKPAVDWYQEEIARLRREAAAGSPEWSGLEASYFLGAEAVHA